MFRAKEDIDHIVIHCAATPDGKKHVMFEGQVRHMDIEEIDLWHFRNPNIGNRSVDAMRTARGHLLAVAYHRIGYPCGAVAKGRMEIEVGSHAGSGKVDRINTRSLSYCLIGKTRFTPAQWEALRSQVLRWEFDYGVLDIIGHSDHAPGRKANCPGFDVGSWIEGGMLPLAGHIMGVN